MTASNISPELKVILSGGISSKAIFAPSEIKRETIFMTMRDGIRLATDLYFPPGRPAPAIAMRTPYGRATLSETFSLFAQRGYVVLSQDCRGTGDSEPSIWDMYMYEVNDGLDFVDWVTKQDWFDGFLSSCGGSYVAETQFAMAMHPHMSTIAPEVGGLGVSTWSGGRYYMFVNAYARSVGKGPDKVPIPMWDMERQMLKETLAGGYFNDPLGHTPSPALIESFPELRSLPPEKGRRWLWEHFCSLDPAGRVRFLKLALNESSINYVVVENLSSIFGDVDIPGYSIFPSTSKVELARSLYPPVLLITGWYDWGLYDTIATWQLLRSEARDKVRSRTRLLISPSAHNVTGYHEGREGHPELYRTFRNGDNAELLLHWYEAIKSDNIDSWPPLIYYLMGANEWRASTNWPPSSSQIISFYLSSDGKLARDLPKAAEKPDRYTYDPDDPTPTVGGSIVSSVYPPGSIDVSGVQKRSDVITYSTAPLDNDLDVVGPLRLTLFAGSSAVETDFLSRLSDVFEDGRAIQLQNGVLRTRYRNLGKQELLDSNRIYRFEIDMWATANRFKAGHCLRLDISSSDFPRFDRNSNLGGKPGAPVPALQTICHDLEHLSALQIPVLSA